MSRPKCFDFAMDFLGDPEATEIRQYVERLEKQLQDEAAANFYLVSKLDESKQETDNGR